MFENLSKYHIILASQSPRRREILAHVGLAFEVRVLPDGDESYPVGIAGEEIARHIALKKALRYRRTMAPDELIITADTIVCIDNKVLGKPSDVNEAFEMLKLLSGRRHEVITSFTVTTAERSECQSVVTKVKFAELTEDMIRHYITHYKPYDKAGAYGIQEWIGYVGVESVEGSFFNVVGLPIQRLLSVLKTF